MWLAKKAGYEGPLRTVRHPALAERFRFWRGASGRRYVCSVFSPQTAPAYETSVALHVRRTPGGPVVVAIRAGSDARPVPAVDEIHIHLVRAEADGLARAIADLAALVAPAIEGDRKLILIRLPQGVRPRRHTRAASHSKAWSRIPSAESSLAVAST
jgi:hypothetical protein